MRAIYDNIETVYWLKFTEKGLKLSKLFLKKLGIFKQLVQNFWYWRPICNSLQL